MDIITPLRVDKIGEWCCSFVLVPKTNGKVRLCLDLVRLNQASIRTIHRGPTLNDILPKLNNVQYMSIIDVSLSYYNLQVDTKSSYLTTFTCPFGRYQYKCLQFRAAPVGDMFQCKIDDTDNTILHPIVFASKSLIGAECRYSNIERETLGILRGLKEFLHYCFAREVLIITDHKQLVAIFKKDVAMLSQCIQGILLKIYQSRVQIIYKPGPKIFIAGWLSRHNH